MSSTASLGLPLLQPSQSQKHVTVNEALVRLDGLSRLVLRSRTLTEPPASYSDGDCFGVAAGAIASWSGQDGAVAIASGGGWIFLPAREGWQAWIEDETCHATFYGGAWRAAVLGLSPSLAASVFRVVETEHLVAAGGAQAIALDIPANTMLFACSARVEEDLVGTASSWSLGFSDQTDKFGKEMGLAAGSYCMGLLSQPTTYYAARQPLLTPVGGVFTSGRLKVAVHYYQIRLPE